jgi:hypothetical protein
VWQYLKSRWVDTEIMQMAALLLPVATLALLAVMSIIIGLGFATFCQ